MSLDKVPIESGYTIFPVWAEESGALSNNNTQWSFGNGATGTIGLSMSECEVFAMSMEADVAGTSVSIELMLNNAAAVSVLFTGANGFEVLATPISFNNGDLLGFRTDVETGAYTDVRVVAWCRVPLQGLQGLAGEDGDSAYQVALNNGFVGTEAEWLASLNTMVNAIGVTETVVYDSGLNSATQDTNDAAITYAWNEAPGVEFTLSGDSTTFTADVSGDYLVNAHIRVTDATANDRANWFVFIEVLNPDDSVKHTLYGSGSYIRDDAAAYDSGSATVSESLILQATEKFRVSSIRLDSQDATDDNPANQTASRLYIRKKNYNII